jgi:hypothetical protein
MAVLYKLNKEDPNNPDVLLLGGAGSMSLNTLKKRVTRRLMEVAELIEENDSPLAWKNALSRTENNVLNDLRTIIEANTELETLRAKGGRISRGIKKA